MITRSAFGKAALGAAAGFSLAFAATRALQALRDLRAPYPARTARDPRHYGAHRRALGLAGAARGVAGLAVTAFALADPLDRALRPLPRPLRAPAFALALLALDVARDLGTDYVEGHVVERVYATSDQSARAWLSDHVKSAAVAAAVTVVLVALADAVVTRAPRRWPLIAIAAMPPLLAFATVIAPTFVMPLFNRYEPVTGELEQRIRALAARYGAGNAAILRFDMSRQTKKANAFVTGVLGTERIALADTLVESFADDETLFVVAHELGHYVRRDPWLGIALGTGAVALTLLAADAALRATTKRGLDLTRAGRAAGVLRDARATGAGAGDERRVARDGTARGRVRARRDRRPRRRRARVPPPGRAEPRRARTAALGGAAVRLASVAGVAYPRARVSAARRRFSPIARCSRTR